MVAREQYLLVVAIISGKKFPKRSSQELVVESRFDGELLSTDPVQHLEVPEFHTELAWELNKKSLHQHRLQRTPIKLQCFAVNTQTKTRESIGYVILDLRSALVKEASPAKLPVAGKWYNLLNTKYTRHKPEIQVGISLEADTAAKDESFKARAAPPRRGQVAMPGDAPPSEFDPSTLTPILNNEEGFYQIGPADSCGESFIISVTIAFAANLSQLMTTDLQLSAHHEGYFFFYSLLGNQVTNDSFKDILNPSFPAERASVRLRSSVNALRTYFQHQPILQIHLCSGDSTLGTADVRLSTLLQQGSDAINRQPLITEGAFQILSSTQRQQKEPPVASSSSPCVGASVALRREEIPLEPPQTQAAGKAGSAPPPQGDSPSTPPRRPTKSPPDSPLAVPHKETPPKKKHKDRGKGAADRGQGSDDDSYGGYTPPQGDSRTDTDADTLRDVDEMGADRQERRKQPAKAATKATSKPKPSHAPQAPQLDFMDVSVRHFCFSIDLRSIKDVVAQTNLNVYLRYTYPFFGSSSPIMTHPPVEVRRQTEVLLPHSFCAFDFATTPQQLRETLMRVPLLVEMWHRDKLIKDQLLGVARVPLSGILSADRARIAPKTPDAADGWRQIFTERVPAETTQGKVARVAELQVVLGLDDYGPIRTQEVYMGPGQDSSQSTSGSSSLPPPSQPPLPPPPAPPPDPRETAEYKAAMELEMWKEQQAGAFENQLKEKELQQLQSLAEEFKRRDRERTLVLKKKTEEYAALEEQLRHALSDVEKRERQLVANEGEVVRLKSDLEREHQHKLVEMQEASRRLKEDCLHQIELEKSRVRVLEEEKQRLASQLTDADLRLAKKDQEYEQFKQESSSKPEIKLQAQINLLTLEKVELERKLESVTKSKIHYKQQWGRALKELARLKQREASEARQRLKKQQQELEHMRLRYLAKEEKEVAQEEKRELQEIKGQLHRLKEGEMAKDRQQQQQPTSHPGEDPMHTDTQPMDPGDSMQHTQDAALEDHVARLIEERDTLLRTGVYTHQDRIISELDKQIRHSIAQKSS